MKKKERKKGRKVRVCVCVLHSMVGGWYLFSLGSSGSCASNGGEEGVWWWMLTGYVNPFFRLSASILCTVLVKGGYLDPVFSDTLHGLLHQNNALTIMGNSHRLHGTFRDCRASRRSK